MFKEKTFFLAFQLQLPLSKLSTEAYRFLNSEHLHDHVHLQAAVPARGFERQFGLRYCHSVM